MPARHRTRNAILVVVGVVVLIVAALIAIGYISEKQAQGKILFSSSPVSTCLANNQVSSAPVGSTVYFSAVLRDHFAVGTALTLTVSLNGAEDSFPASPQGSGYDCLYEQIPPDILNQPGTLTLTFTDTNGTVEATGSLTITAAP